MRKHVLVAFVLAAVPLSLALGEVVEEKYPSGKVKAKFEVDGEGKKNGYYVEYHENGKLKVKATCKADEFEGAYLTYYPSGQPHITAAYKAGQLTGPYSEKDEKGKLRMSAVYKAGKLNGLLKHYDKGKEVFAHPFSDGEPVFARSLEKTKAVIEKLRTPTTAEENAEEPLKDRLAALRRLKIYRFLVGVPYENLQLDDEYNRCCDAGARLCEKIGQLDHRPKNPGLPEDEYKLGYKGTSQSNLALGTTSLPKAVDLWMDDSDKSNIDRLGHRRWCLNPAMLRTGFGKSGKFTAMYAFDKGQPKVPDYDYVAFPSPGYMPVEFFGKDYAWNVSLNPKKYQKPASAKARIYEVDALLNMTGEPLSLNFSRVDTGGFGIPYCVIFRPDKPNLADGQRYMVEIDGLYNLANQPIVLKFLVVFVKLD